MKLQKFQKISSHRSNSDKLKCERCKNATNLYTDNRNIFFNLIYFKENPERIYKIKKKKMYINL